MEIRETYLKVGAAVPTLKVGNPEYNAEEILTQVQAASEQGIQLLAFPELALTGSTCDDLFFQRNLLQWSRDQLKKIIRETKPLDMIIIFGMPFLIQGKNYNTAVVLHHGKILGIVLKKHLSSYEKRWFCETTLESTSFDNSDIPVGSNLQFQFAETTFEVILGSTFEPTNAMLCVHLDSREETVETHEQVLKNIQVYGKEKGYLYVSSGSNESSSDAVYSGLSAIAEDSDLLKLNDQFCFESTLISTEFDLEQLKQSESDSIKQPISVSLHPRVSELTRTYSKFPFLPTKNETDYYEQVLEIQATALARRLRHLNLKKTVLGMSGGLDSTLAFLVMIRAYQKLNLPSTGIIAVTMPGFGTTKRTYENAVSLVHSYKATLKEISICESCLVHFKDIGHDPNIHDVVYENAQARERTQILMDIANQEHAIVVGTGDLSELALGWCTYNGDHMSMYGINSGVPKTLVKSLVEHISKQTSNQLNKNILKNIVATPISPELLPLDSNGKLKQKTETSVGPYELHDFYIYHFLKEHMNPKKILWISEKTFPNYSKEELNHWLSFFLKRFFSQQFKRNCMPDGPQITDISLSPRAGLIMGSDLDGTMWLY